MIHRLAAATLVALTCLAGGPAAAFEEQGVKRWGADYAQFSTNAASECRLACETDEECRSWTFVKPKVISATGTCQLKSAVPMAAADPCCISGIPVGASIGQMAGPGRPPEGSEMAMPANAAVGVAAATPRPAANAPPIDIKPAIKK